MRLVYDGVLSWWNSTFFWAILVMTDFVQNSSIICPLRNSWLKVAPSNSKISWPLPLEPKATEDLLCRWNTTMLLRLLFPFWHIVMEPSFIDHNKVVQKIYLVNVKELQFVFGNSRCFTFLNWIQYIQYLPGRKLKHT